MEKGRKINKNIEVGVSTIRDVKALLNQNTNKRGITLVALIITIVIMLILASITVNVSINGGLFEYTKKSKLETEITELQGILMKKQMINEGQILNGTINEILGIKSDYNDKLGIEDGELVYFAGKFTEKEQNLLEKLGVTLNKSDKQNIICKENPTTFYIVDDINKLKYSAENIGSMWDWATKKSSNTFKNSNGDAYKTTIIIENIDLNCSEEKQWVPYSLDSETFDGQNHTISGIYINNASDTVGLFKDATNSTIKNIIIENGYIYTTNANAAGVLGRCSGRGNVNIINCVNKAEVYGSTNTGGIVGYIMRPNGNYIIEGCANFGKISSASYCGGIVGRILNETRNSKYKKLL